MATLLHEIWMDAGKGACCLAGPDGESFRQLLSPAARLVHTFEAGSHSEALKTYYQFMEYGDYKPDFEWKNEPYPEEWAERQQRARLT